jgi:hypothetical protein
MNWNVYFSEKAGKQAKKLNKRVISILDLLVFDLKLMEELPERDGITMEN